MPRTARVVLTKEQVDILWCGSGKLEINIPPNVDRLIISNGLIQTVNNFVEELFKNKHT